MKLPSLLLPILAAGAVAASQPDFIRQIQQIEGATVIYDIPISGDSGEVWSQPIEAESSIFQLWAYVPKAPGNGNGNGNGNGTSQLELKKLDEKTVGSYMPKVTLQPLSEDPYVPARTRADRPYGMRLVVSDLSTDPADPAYLREVEMRRSYQVYDSITHRPPADGSGGGTYADTFSFHNNGTFTDGSILQRLPVDRPSKAMGEETFTVFTHPTAPPAPSQIASATVQIWPVADAEITEIVADKVYLDVPPLASVILNDLYPKSHTYVQLYSGPPNPGTVGEILETTVVTYNTFEPQDARLSLEGLGELVEEDGRYTLEVLTITPFNGGAPERLAYVSFVLDRTIEVNAQISTMEKD